MVGSFASALLMFQLTRYGINSQVSALAYQPVQSLLAVGTKDTQYGPGQVYVFGQRRVCVTFPLQRRASVREIQFCGERLIVLDDKNDITIFSLDTKKRIATYAPPGQATCLVTDPSLDYCLTGLQNGGSISRSYTCPGLTPDRRGSSIRSRSGINDSLQNS